MTRRVKGRIPKAALLALAVFPGLFGQSLDVLRAGEPVAAQGQRPNLFPNPGFEVFVENAPMAQSAASWGNPTGAIKVQDMGSAPKGWTVSSWNQEFVRERFGFGTPGHDGSGRCLEMAAQEGGSTVGLVTFVSDPFPVRAETSYFFLGFYASTCQWLEVRAEWLDAADKSVGLSTLRLPDTQDEWVHFFKEVQSPVGAAKVRWTIEKKWQSGRARFDDFSLREGRALEFAGELGVPGLPSEPWFPIFSWMGPKRWDHFGAEKAELFDRDEYHLDYALANFNVGWSKKSGLRYFPTMGSVEAVERLDVGTANQDEALWCYRGPDEPLDDRFPELGKVARLLAGKGAVKPYWINLLPTYGFPNYEAYEKHVRAFMEAVPTKLVTYDHYTLQKEGENFVHRRDFFANLEIFRRVALEKDVDWGIILQVVAWGGQPSPNENALRWQAFNSLVYGAHSLGWFTYLTEIEYGGMNWRDAVIGWDGNRTHNYTKIRRLNARIAQIGRTLIGLQSTGVYHTTPLPELTRDFTDSKLVSQITGGGFVLGEFRNSKGGIYFMVSNRNINSPATATLLWKSVPEKLEEVSPKSGELISAEGFQSKNDQWVLALAPGEGRLFRVIPSGLAGNGVKSSPFRVGSPRAGSSK